MSGQKSEERLTDLVGRAVCYGDCKDLSDELDAMRLVASTIAKTEGDNPSIRLLAAAVADLSHIVGLAIAFPAELRQRESESPVTSSQLGLGLD